MVVRKVRKPRVREGGRGSSPGKKSGSGESSGHPVYALEKKDAIYCHDFRKVVPVQPEDKERILSKMKEDRWALNYVLKVLGNDRKLAEKVAKEGIPKDLYRELFSTLSRYGVPDWILKGALSEATKIVKQWYSSTFQKGHVPKAKALRLYVPSAWYNPKTGYLELPENLKLREVGGNRACENFPIIAEWAQLVYNPAYGAFFLVLVRKIPPKERKLNIPLSYMKDLCRKYGKALARDYNVEYIVIGTGKKELERRYPTLFTAINGSEPDRRPSVLCYGSSSRICDILEKLRDRYSRLYNTLKRLREKYPDYDPRNISKGPGRRIWLILRKMSVIDRVYMKEIAKDIINYAIALGGNYIPYCIVLEDLRGLQERIKEESDKPKGVKSKIIFMAYSKFDKSIITLAKLYGVPYAFVDPRGTSTTCPKCGAKMVQVEDPVIGKRTMYCPNCGFKEDRDTVAIMNLVKRFLSSSL